MTSTDKDQDNPVCAKAGTLGNLGARVVKLEGSEKEQWDAINHLRNRLPNWAVMLIAGLSGALGWTLQIAFG